MENLLTRLHQCDPATYTKWSEGIRWVDNQTAEVASAYSPENIAWLQICLQEAIAENGWWLELSTYTLMPTAKIEKQAAASFLWYHRAGDSLASALLAAYVAAKEEP